MSDKVVKKFGKLSVEERKAAISKLNEMAYAPDFSNTKTSTSTDGSAEKSSRSKKSSSKAASKVESKAVQNNDSGDESDGSSDEKPKRRVKKEKDPNAPKRALNGYMYYSQERRASLKAERPDLKTKELSVVMGEEWRHMNDEQKRPYSVKGAADKERYAQAKASYAK